MVMIADDDVNAVLSQMRDELDLGDATISRDQERKSLVFEALDHGLAEAVPSLTIREVNLDPVSPKRPQRFIKQRGAGDAVNVEIPLDEDLFAVAQGAVNALDGLADAAQLPGRVQICSVGIEEFLGVLRSAGCEHSR
jgi:hypothetical protein